MAKELVPDGVGGFLRNKLAEPGLTVGADSPQHHGAEDNTSCQVQVTGLPPVDDIINTISEYPGNRQTKARGCCLEEKGDD